MLNDKENNSSRIQFLQQNVDKNDSKMHTCLQIDLKFFFFFNSDKCMQSKTMTLLIYKADNQHIWDSLIHQNWMKIVWNIQFVEY